MHAHRQINNRKPRRYIYLSSHELWARILPLQQKDGPQWCFLEKRADVPLGDYLSEQMPLLLSCPGGRGGGRLGEDQNGTIESVVPTSTLHLKKTRQLWQAVVSPKHGLILIMFGKQHQHTVENDTSVQLSLSHHFYLLHLLLNSCDRNDTFCHSSMLAKQSSSFSRKHRILSLQMSVHQTVRLTTEFLDWCRNVCTSNTCAWHQSLWP